MTTTIDTTAAAPTGQPLPRPIAKAGRAISGALRRLGDIDWLWISEQATTALLVLIWLCAVPYGLTTAQEIEAQRLAITTIEAADERLMDHLRHDTVEPTPRPSRFVRVRVGGVIVKGEAIP